STFTIVTPAGVSHIFTNGPIGSDGMSVEYEAQVANDAVNGDHFHVVGKIKQNGKEVGKTSQDYPMGSVLQNDPPQPNGLNFRCPDAVPASRADQSLVLAAMGMPQTQQPMVWNIPSGNFLFSSLLFPPPELVHMQCSYARGDMNCDGLVNNFDI